MILWERDLSAAGLHSVLPFSFSAALSPLPPSVPETLELWAPKSKYPARPHAVVFCWLSGYWVLQFLAELISYVYVIFLCIT